MELTDPMAFMLYEEVSEMYGRRSASFTELLERLRARRARALAVRSMAEANIAEGLIRRILPLALDERRRAVNLKGSDQVIIYDLSVLPTYQLRSLYAEVILWRLYNEARSSASMRVPELKAMIVAEESQNYVRPRRAERLPGIGERIVNELRAYGYGAILVSPDPSQLPWHLSRDAGAVISIGYQVLPQVVVELLNVYRYADVRMLMRTTHRPRTYVYHDGRLYVRGMPRPYVGAIDLGAAVREEVVGEESKEGKERLREEKPELKVEEEEIPLEAGSREVLKAEEPRGGRITLA